MEMPFPIKPGALIVFEGLDGTGKTTQHEHIERACVGLGHGSEPLFEPEPLFLHMPTAGTNLGQAIYEITEAITEDLDPLARQFLHLASHSQSVRFTIKPAREEGRPVFLDRWWWSTFAYGHEAMAKRFRMTYPELVTFLFRVWRRMMPDVVFLFMHPHVEDAHNTPSVVEGYQLLMDAYSWGDRLVLVEQGDQNHQTLQIMDALLERGIYRSN